MFFIFSINNIFLNHSLGIFSVPTLAVFGPVGPEVGTVQREAGSWSRVYGGIKRRKEDPG